MTTIDADADQQPPFRPYKVQVKELIRLSPHFKRIVFTGEHLDRFGIDDYDQRIKILLPLADGSWPDPHLFDLTADSNRLMG